MSFPLMTAATHQLTVFVVELGGMHGVYKAAVEAQILYAPFRDVGGIITVEGHLGDGQEELDCLLGDSQDICSTRQPDILVVNSGLHDAATSVQHFIQHLERASDLLSHIAMNGPKVRSSTLLPHTRLEGHCF